METYYTMRYGLEDDERTALLVKSFKESLQAQARRRRRVVVAAMTGLLVLCSAAAVVRTTRGGEEMSIVLRGGRRRHGPPRKKNKTSSLSSASDAAPWFWNGYYYEGALRTYYRGDVVRAACPNNDDDQEFLPKCPAHDEASWCQKPEVTGPGTKFDSVCRPACQDKDMAWAMVCAWQAVANLESVCAGTFQPSPPSRSRNAPNAAWLPRNGVTAEGGKLYGCDEHAVCSACFYGGQATSLGGEMCERVAAHYGAFGHLDERNEQVSGYTGAEAAFAALSELDKWCASFDPAKELAQRRDFGFVPAWVGSFGGDDGESGEYVQRWGHVGGERVEEHLVRDVDRHQERFAQDAYAYWRYVLQADSEYDLDSSSSVESSSSSSATHRSRRDEDKSAKKKTEQTRRLDVTTHVHTSALSLEKALAAGRVAAGAILFVDVIYAMLDVQHFPGYGERNTFAAIGWIDDDQDESDSSASEESYAASLRQGCRTDTATARSYCKKRINKECVYQHAPDLLRRSTTLRAILSYEKPLTLVIGGDLACRLQDLPLTHHKLLFANDAGADVEAYNAKIARAEMRAPLMASLLPRASWFPFGLEGVRVLSDPTASALDADSSGARLDEWPLAAADLASKRFFLTLSASLNRRKPSRSTLYDWLVTQGGYDTLEKARLTAATATGRLPNSVEFTDNRPPYGKKGRKVKLGAAALDDAADMTRRSVFAVAPAGDFWTSGRVLETLMLGAVPVVDATYSTKDGAFSTKGCRDPAAFWRAGSPDFPRAAPFLFVERWRDLPALLEPFANDETLLAQRLSDLQDYRVALEQHLRTLPLSLKRHLDDDDPDSSWQRGVRGWREWWHSQKHDATAPQEDDPAAPLRASSSSSFSVEPNVTTRVYSTCETTQWSFWERAGLLEDARAYYADPDWAANYADSPGAPGIGCTKYDEIRDMFPAVGAACYDAACAPSLVKDFSCHFVVEAPPDDESSSSS